MPVSMETSASSSTYCVCLLVCTCTCIHVENIMDGSRSKCDISDRWYLVFLYYSIRLFLEIWMKLMTRRSLIMHLLIQILLQKKYGLKTHLIHSSIAKRARFTAHLVLATVDNAITVSVRTLFNNWKHP
jgi:hypothetical protein